MFCLYVPLSLSHSLALLFSLSHSLLTHIWVWILIGSGLPCDLVFGKGDIFRWPVQRAHPRGGPAPPSRGAPPRSPARRTPPLLCPSRLPPLAAFEGPSVFTSIFGLNLAGLGLHDESSKPKRSSRHVLVRRGPQSRASERPYSFERTVFARPVAPRRRRHDRPAPSHAGGTGGGPFPPQLSRLRIRGRASEPIHPLTSHGSSLRFLAVGHESQGYCDLEAV